MKSAFFKNPILIIDRSGLIGEPLCLKLSQEFSVVFVGRKNLDSSFENKNIVHVSFSGKFPIIPDNKYSHIVFIDEEGQDLEFLPKIIEKVKDVNADFIVALGLLSGGKYLVSKISRLYPSAKIAIFGDIFDNILIQKREKFRSVINKLIYQTQKFGKMQVLGEGLSETYPVFLQDVVDGLIDILFGIQKSHSLFYIFPKYPPSELSLAHMIQKINPEITIDFIKRDLKSTNISYPPNGKNLLSDNYPIAQKIRRVDIKKKAKTQIEFSGGEAEKFRKLPFFIVWILIFLFISPFIFTSFFSFLGFNTLYYAKGELDRGNFSNAKSSLHLSETLFYIGKQAADVLLFQAKVTGIENSLKKQSLDLDSGYKISQALLQVFNSGVYFSKILSGKSTNPLVDFAKGENYLKNSIIILDKEKAEGKIPAPILQKLEIINPLIKLLATTSDIAPSIFGIDSPKTYLILLQNNLELRPGGGIIDSYGILKFNLGKITDFSMHSVADADSQLRGHVEPPFAIRRYLPSKHWYMKDSNFDVDFVNSTFSSSNFIFVETGQRVDGVITIDNFFIKSILHAIGPVYVADYKQTIDENNFYALMQSHVDKDFLRSLSKVIMTKMAEKKVSYLLIGQAISDTLTQKHLLLTFKDWQSIFTVNGWSSSLWDDRKESNGTVNDFVGISEANLGMNKANYYLKRKVSQKVTIENNGNTSEELEINYRNESNVWPGGDYKNYLRIILPKNIELSEILINDIPQVLVNAITDPLVYEAKNFKVPPGLEIEKTQEEGKSIIGFLVRVPKGEIIKVKLKYMLAQNTSLDTFSYNLKLFKQPGIDSIPYSLSLTYPKSFNFIKGSEGTKGRGEKVVYSENIAEDKNLIINFAKNK
jgi:hypothetical protein